MAGYFELTRAGAGFNFNLRAGNGEVVLSSQVYRSKASARKGVSAVQLNGRDPARCQPRTASNGQPYFVLLAANGKVIGQSEMYASISGRDGGIDSVVRNAASQEVRDLTAQS